jgi:hypothetical protein
MFLSRFKQQGGTLLGLGGNEGPNKQQYNCSMIIASLASQFNTSPKNNSKHLKSNILYCTKWNSSKKAKNLRHTKNR